VSGGVLPRLRRGGSLSRSLGGPRNGTPTCSDRSWSRSLSRRCKHESGDSDLLGLFQTGTSPQRCHGGDPRGRYWSTDSRGRPFRLPFRPTESDLERARSLDQRIVDFVNENQLETRVARIMHNMLPDDVERVLEEGTVPQHCSNPNAVVVARVRRIEKAAQRPNAMKRYDTPAADPPRRSHHSRSRSRCRSGRGVAAQSQAYC